MSRELFTGHTPREQWVFFNHSVWFASAFVLFLANSTIRSMYYPFVSIINVFASFAHWSSYNPKSIAQKIDIGLAAMIIVLLVFEVSKYYDEMILTLIGILFLSCFLDVYHERLTNGYTTHVTGTFLHFILRSSGITLGIIGCVGSNNTIVVYVFLCQFIHCILSYGLYFEKYHITCHITFAILSFVYMICCSLFITKLN